ncbi:hypothetical protein [Dyadobacter bucti]|uniref:hypothetical protein n=1 Tax=Dyadobacter bucti TaxID=2572203 RepID=UPI003F7182C4
MTESYKTISASQDAIATYSREKTIQPGSAKVVYVPENLDIKELIRDQKQGKFTPTTDRMKYILGLFYELPSKDKELLQSIEKGENPYIPLSSKILKSVIYDYQNYLELLERKGVIESDHHYIVDKKCIGYRLTNAYLVRGTNHKIHDKKLLRALSLNSSSAEAIKKFPNLVEWFQGLSIDEKSARAHLNEIFDEQKKATNVEHALSVRYTIYDLMVSRIVSKDYFFVVDRFSNRLHTALTNMKSSLRKYVSYNGKILSAIDLSGSQPFLLLNLLTPSFYDDKEKEKINLSNINQSIIPKLSIPVKAPSLYSIMCGKFKNEAEVEEIDKYKYLVKHNRFYEYIRDAIRKPKRKAPSREKVKDIVMTIYFAPNDHPSKHIQKKFAIFREQFPFTADVIQSWKIQRSNTLAQVLQRIESFIFLEKIAQFIGEQWSDLPIFTVHDSIVTLADEADNVQEIMHWLIQEITGYTPHFKRDEWAH